MAGIGFIGAGNMARALAGGIAARFPDMTILAADPSPAARALMLDAVPAVQMRESNAALAAESDMLVLAVKPGIALTLSSEIGSFAGLLVSIAAGVPLARLETSYPLARVIRMMPNTPALVGRLAAGLFPGSRASAEDRERCMTVFGSLGIVREMSEDLVHAVIATSGSGPAFWARLAGWAIDEGCALGLDADVARELVLATMSGTAELLNQSGMSPDELVTAVSSPGGTTIAGREHLEDGRAEDSLRKTMQRSAQRSREMLEESAE